MVGFQNFMALKKCLKTTKKSTMKMRIKFSRVYTSTQLIIIEICFIKISTMKGDIQFIILY